MYKAKHMKTLLFLLTLFFIHINLTLGQEKTFILEGKIDIDTGNVKLILVGDTSVYPNSLRHLISPVINGQFKFVHGIPHPMAFMLESTSGYLSGVIVIEPGTQKVICHRDSSRKVPEIYNSVMQEYARFRVATKELNAKNLLFDQEERKLMEKYPEGVPESLKGAMKMKLQALYDEGDQTLLAFIKENPGSYWALWRLISLTNFGYEKIFDEMMPLFADSIKGSFSGKALFQILKRSSILSVGNKFPQMELLQINGERSPGISFANSKYTLIDFWYTRCAPCIAGFPSFVKIYDKYHNKGFEIVGIATDALKYKQDLPIVIKKHMLPWLQYWDLNGKGLPNYRFKHFRQISYLMQTALLFTKILAARS